MSQVKNLRAMFEASQRGGDTSPPDDRGRSSGASTPTPGANGTDSPRPLSKVRTSFVAIEKDGRIGLQRNPSHESSTSRRRLSMASDADSTSTAPDRPVVASDDVARAPKLVLHETIPESPRHPPDPEKTLDDAVPVFDEPITTPDSNIDEKRIDEVKPAAPLPVEPAPKSPTKAPKPSTTPTPVNGKPKTEKPKATPLITPAKTEAVKKPTTRPTAISTKPSSTKPPAKSPLPKTPTSATSKASSNPVSKAAVSKASISKAPATKAPVSKAPVSKVTASNAHTKPAVKKESATSRAASVPRPTAGAAAKKPQPLKTSASETGFVKPKPKSPTKPVHLPASLMAPTASSVSKGANGRQTQLRPSRSVANLTARPVSRASVSTTGTSAGGKSVIRKDSSIGRSRPSLGPPPKKENPDGAVAKKDVPVDESFLARMMRPTQASQSKTNEKVPITPPRKTSSRLSLTGTEPRRETHSRLGSAKKPVRKQVGSSVASDYAPSKELSPSPAIDATTVFVPEPVPELPLEPIAKPTKVYTSQEPIEWAKDVELAPEAREDAGVSVSVEKDNEDTSKDETIDNAVKPVQQEVALSEVALEEPAVEDDEPVTTEEPNAEEDKPVDTSEIEAVKKPDAVPENVAGETKEPIAVAKSKPTEEPSKLEEAPVVEDEPVTAEVAPASVVETATEQHGESETKVEADSSKVSATPDAEQLTDTVVEENPVEDEKEEAKSVSKEDAAA